MTECKNCGTSFEGKFCPTCSQKADTHRLTLKHLAHETTHAVTHTDKGILLLMKAMMTKPGLVAREYVEGKRKKYFNPITFLLIMMAIMVFATKQSDFNGKFTRQMKKIYEQAAKLDPKMIEQEKKFDEQIGDADKKMSFANDNSKMINFVFIPFLSLLTWLFFKKSKFNYAENLLLNVLLGGQAVILFLLFCIIPILIMPSLILLVMNLFVLISLVYSIVAYKQFYEQKWGWTIVKGLALQLIYLAIILFATEYIVNFFA